MELNHLYEVTGSIDLSKHSNKAPDPASDSEIEDFQGSESDWNPNTSDCVSEEEILSKQIIKSTKRKKSEPQGKTMPRRNYKTQPPAKLQRNSVIPQTNCTYIGIPNQISLYKSQPEMRLLNKTLPNLNMQPRVSNLINSNDNITDNITNNITDNFDKLIHDGEKRLTIAFKDVPSPAVPKIQVPPMTFDQQTQTTSNSYDEKSFLVLLENQKLLRSEMISLYKTLNDMKKQMDAMKNTTTIVQAVKETYAEVISLHQNTNVEAPCVETSPYDFNEVDERNVPILKDSNTISNEGASNIEWNVARPNYKFEERPTSPNARKQTDENVSSATNYSEANKCLEMVPIGSGKTLVPHHIFSQIKWSSHSFATRKLLMAVFPRRTLATHSLTGKSSPAFTNRPPKMQLDAKKISDIIITVTQKCKVQEGLVRNIITTKCSDENKMYRMRMKKKNKNGRDGESVNQENQCPENID